MVNRFWKKIVKGEGNGGTVKVNETTEDSNGIVDGLLWYKDLGVHSNGEFSMAVIQATGFLEDQSQIESGALSSHVSGPYGTFIGVYDGHGGPEASRFVCNTLFSNLKKFSSVDKEISENVIKAAFMETESEFLSHVRQQWLFKPQMASVGTCCLVGVICNGFLYIANAGDSRVVAGRGNKTGNGVTAIQLSEEHNVNIESVRAELQRLNPNDPQIVVQKHEVWRVKGIIQVTRSIGDAYLKNSEFNREPLLPKFRLPEPFDDQILSPEPSILVQKLNPNDQFLIFASDGLWEYLNNQEAVEIVKKNPRHGIARKLVEAALCIAAKKREILYSDLKDIGAGVRRYFHDDITVVIVFLDPSSGTSSCPRVSIRGGGSLNER